MRKFVITAGVIMLVLLVVAVTVLFLDHTHQTCTDIQEGVDTPEDSLTIRRIRGKHYYISLEDPRQHFEQNTWWRYAKFRAHSSNTTNCHVCSHMPVSSTNQGARARSLSYNHTRCLLALSTHPGGRTMPSAVDYSIPLTHASPLVHVNCTRDILGWPQLHNTVAMENIIYTQPLIMFCWQRHCPCCRVNC